MAGRGSVATGCLLWEPHPRRFYDEPTTHKCFCTKHLQQIVERRYFAL